MQLGLHFGLGVCPSSILKPKKNPTQHQKTHCFLSRQHQIALGWSWRSREALQRERGPESPSAEEFPALGGAGAGGCSHGAGRGLDAGTSRAGQEAAAATHGDAVAATHTFCTGREAAGVRGGVEERFGGGRGGERSSRGAQLWPGDKALPLRARLVQSSQRCRERATLSRLHFEWKLKSAVKQVQKSL